MITGTPSRKFSPITTQTGGSLVTIDFHVQPGAAAGATPIQLVAAVNPTGRKWVSTEISDAQGPFLLNPAPSQVGSPGGVSGSIDVVGKVLPKTILQSPPIPHP